MLTQQRPAEDRDTPLAAYGVVRMRKLALLDV